MKSILLFASFLFSLSANALTCKANSYENDLDTVQTFEWNMDMSSVKYSVYGSADGSLWSSEVYEDAGGVVGGINIDPAQDKCDRQIKGNATYFNYDASCDLDKTVHGAEGVQATLKYDTAKRSGVYESIRYLGGGSVNTVVYFDDCK